MLFNDTVDGAVFLIPIKQNALWTIKAIRKSRAQQLLDKFRLHSPLLSLVSLLIAGATGMMGYPLIATLYILAGFGFLHIYQLFVHEKKYQEILRMLQKVETYHSRVGLIHNRLN